MENGNKASNKRFIKRFIFILFNFIFIVICTHLYECYITCFNLYKYNLYPLDLDYNFNLNGYLFANSREY